MEHIKSIHCMLYYPNHSSWCSGQPIDYLFKVNNIIIEDLTGIKMKQLHS